MAEEEILQEGRFNEEQRLREEAILQERRNRCIEVVQEISDLEKAQDLAVNRLRRLINRSITVVNFSIVEENYLNLVNVNSALNTRILDWEDLLELDEEGAPIYPDQGQPEYRYSPEAEDFSNKTRTMEIVTTQSIEVLKAFFVALPVAEKAIVSQLAQRDWIPENRDPGHDDGQEGVKNKGIKSKRTRRIT